MWLKHLSENKYRVSTGLRMCDIELSDKTWNEILVTNEKVWLDGVEQKTVPAYLDETIDKGEI